MCGHADMEPTCGNLACRAWEAWAVGVETGRLVDVSALAQTVGFVVPVALSQRLWQDLPEEPGETGAWDGPGFLEALLTQAFHILQLSQCPCHQFSFRMPRPGSLPNFLSVFLTSQVDPVPKPIAFFLKGEEPWITMPGAECSRCAYSENVYHDATWPLKGAIGLPY